MGLAMPNGTRIAHIKTDDRERKTEVYPPEAGQNRQTRKQRTDDGKQGTNTRLRLRCSSRQTSNVNRNQLRNQ